MARPKYTADDAKARERLIEAFWDTLSEEPLEKMGVRSLSARAGLNKNTFYYHFDNIDALADAALDGVLVKEVPKAILARNLGGSHTGHVTEVAMPEEKLNNLSVLLSRNGNALHFRLADVISNVWLHMFEERGVAPDENGAFMLRFAAGGLVNALRDLDTDALPAMVERIGSSSMVSSLIDSITTGGAPFLREKQKDRPSKTAFSEF